MSYAQGSRSGLVYVVESSFGVTPSTPTMIRLPFSTHSLNLTRSRQQGTDILPDRIPRVDRHGVQQAVGDIAAQFRPADYDALLESAFFDSFGTSGADSLIIGTTPQFMSIEDQAVDISEYRVFRGMAVSQFSLNVQPDAIPQATFSLVGRGMSAPASTTAATATTAESGEEPFDAFSGSISENGSAIAIVSSLQFSLNNSLGSAHAIGSRDAAELEFGRAEVEGSVSVYYEDSTFIEAFLAEEERSLQLVLDNTVSGETYTFDFPRIKYNDAAVPVADPQSRIVQLPFVALFDESESTNIKLTRGA